MMECPYCGSSDVIKDGSQVSAHGRQQRIRCRDCNKSHRIPLVSGGSDPEKHLSSEEMVKRLQKSGFTILKEPPKQESYTAFSGRFKDLKTLKFAAFSCPHLGSRYQQLSALNSFYDLAKAKGCTHVICAGDVFDGNGRVYRGQEFEIFKHGYDSQLDYGTEFFPKRSGMQTVAIAGNHDASFFSGGGADILQALAARRSDITYLGQYGGTFSIDKDYQIFIMHGKGGGAYARSYKMQKIIEQFAPQQKPHMLLLGHWHSFAHLPMYRNVTAWQLGCFQSQTPFEKTLGLYPEIGGLIFRISLGGQDRLNGTALVHTEFVPYYVPKDNDYGS